MAVRRERHLLTLNADWPISDLFFARRIDLTVLHSTLERMREKRLTKRVYDPNVCGKRGGASLV